MRPIKHTLLFDDALQVILENAAPIERRERVGLREADGRVAAADVIAQIDVPPFDRAAMDGFAVIAEDTFGAGTYAPRLLQCVEKVYTGQVPLRAVARGECSEISTGAPMPEGADAVVMVEETEKGADGAIRIFTPVYPKQHVGRKAADIAAGQTIIGKGAVLNPSRVG